LDAAIDTTTYEAKIKELHLNLPVAISWLNEVEDVVTQRLSSENPS
jgi:hypothetical protein